MGNESQKRAFQKRLLLFLYKAVYLILCISTFFISWLVFRYGDLDFEIIPAFRYDLLTAAAYAILLIFLNRTYNNYLFGYRRIRHLVFTQLIAQFFSLFIIYAAVSLFWMKFYNAWPLLLVLPCDLLIDTLWSLLGNRIFFALYPKIPAVLIYRNAVDKKHFGEIKGKPMDRMFQIVEEIQYDGDFHGISDRLAGFDAIFVSGVNSACRNGILKYCKEAGVAGYFLPHVGDVLMRSAKHIQAFDSPVLCVERKVLNPEYAFVKRAFDIFFALVLIVLTSPIMLVTALLIKCYDKGPAIYKQVRLTRNGREFRILKFRSMRVDAEKDGVARLSTGDKDDRITPIGRFIRKCRIDELPQLFNILKGDMSVVGPRPERPEIAEKYYQSIPEFQLRLQIKAGLTGYAQVYGKYNSDPYEKLEFDLLYINEMSIGLDIRLMFATFSILFEKDSTDGIKEGQTTALIDSDSSENKE